jgi:AcrR family transcriptional regulator
MVAPRDAERTRDLLLDAGLACFAERGFDGTSIRAIAARAGLSLGLLYHYFPSKEALLHELMRRSGGLIQAVFVEVAAEPDAQRRLEALVRVSIRSMRDHLPFYQLSAKMRAQPEVMGALSPSTSRRLRPPWSRSSRPCSTRSAWTPPRPTPGCSSPRWTACVFSSPPRPRPTP